MKRLIFIGFCFCLFGLMAACNDGKVKDAIADTSRPLKRADCDGVIYPDHAPSLEYLNYFDTNGSFRWFEKDTLWIMYDDDYPEAEMPKQINGVPTIWLTRNGDNSLGVVTDSLLPQRWFIELGYESHCDSHLYVSVYEVHYDGDFGPDGATHDYCQKYILDSIIHASHDRKCHFDE